VDLEVFLSAKKVIDGITSRSCARALAWCGENRSRLVRINSTLEFNLRVQEFIELVHATMIIAMLLII
jgi:macrophage erythroblast attacher